MTLLFNKSFHLDFRRELRARSTPSECLLWRRLCRDQLGARFRRQFGIGRYIVDFYAPRKKIVIEVDGGYHFASKEQKIYDEIRNAYLTSLDLQVLHFTNDEVRLNINAVIETIQSALSPPFSFPPPPSPSTKMTPPSSQEGAGGSPNVALPEPLSLP